METKELDIVKFRRELEFLFGIIYDLNVRRVEGSLTKKECSACYKDVLHLLRALNGDISNLHRIKKNGNE